MKPRIPSASTERLSQQRRTAIGALLIGSVLALPPSLANAKPYRPADDAAVLAELPASTRHLDIATRQTARTRLDVALRLARFYIERSRSNGDLRLLGYAESMLRPWIDTSNASTDALVLQATVLQSRHDFAGALELLTRALQLKERNPQAWLVRATVLRVLGRYEEAMQACELLSRQAQGSAGELCSYSLRGLAGHLDTAYTTLARLSTAGMSNAELAWRDCELGEMAVRLGLLPDAERWFRSGLQTSPDDFYLQAAYADLLLAQHRPEDVLTLLKGREDVEPLLLRAAIAQKQLGDPDLEASRKRLAAAFEAEAQRHEGIHGREAARFLLDVESNALASLEAATANWQVQHETEDVLILVRAAQASGRPEAAAPALAFVRRHGLQDVRLQAALKITSSTHL